MNGHVVLTEEGREEMESAAQRYHQHILMIYHSILTMNLINWFTNSYIYQSN